MRLLASSLKLLYYDATDQMTTPRCVTVGRTTRMREDDGVASDEDCLDDFTDNDEEEVSNAIHDSDYAFI